MKSSLIQGLLFSFMTSFGYSQSEIPVDMHTGTPVISIPLWTINDHDLSHTVGIYFDASGLKLEQTPNRVGLGWEIFGSGKISREVRGLPDDFDGIQKWHPPIEDFDHRRGWLRPIEGTSTLPAQSVGDFLPTSDLSEATCNDELADFNKMVGYNEYVDTEPDIFHFSFNGLSGSFVFDNSSSPEIRLIPYQDVKIAYSVNQTTNDIIAFTIKTNQGITYYFDRPVVEEFSIQQPAAQFFNRYALLNTYDVLQVTGEYDYTGHLTYNSQWMLTKIESFTGSEITFNYSQNDFEFQDTLKVGIRRDTISVLNTFAVHETYRKLQEQRLNTISSSTGQRLEFHYEDSLIQLIQVIDEFKHSNTLVKEFIFSHREIMNPADDFSKRYFLESVQEKSGDISLPPFKFSYTGVNFLSNRTSLPSHQSKAKDFWGYYNGKTGNHSLFPKLYVYPELDYPDKVKINAIPGYTGQEIILSGADRRSDPVLMEIGALNKIQYPLGGALHIDYEPNTYFDGITNSTFIGGGLRVRALTFFDGIDPSSAVYKEFSYEEQPGKSSGRLLAQPVFYIPTPKYVFKPEFGPTITKTYSELATVSAEELWDRLLVRTEENLAKESLVRYMKVTVKKPGSGWATVEFDLPAVAGDLTSGEWLATSNKFARYSSCEPLGIIHTGGAWRFPFAYNPNFQHERGNQIKKYDYNEAGVLVKETTNTYQYLYKQGSAPVKVWGLDFEKVPHLNAYAFGKYFLLTDVIKVPLLTTERIYDEGNSSKSISRTVEFLYESTYHKLQTGSRTTNSDGTIYTSKITYPLDFGTVPSTTDKAAAMISKLQTDFRNGVPIETYQTIQKPGDTQKVLSATLVKFNDFGTPIPLMETSHSLSALEPLSNFNPATIQLVEGQHKLIGDTHYETVSEITAYENAYKLPLAFKNPISKTVGGTLWGYNGSVPVAQINYATPDQIAFSDFETSTSASFHVSEIIYGNGRTGLNAIHPSVKLSRIINKGSGDQYILSFWLKTNGTPVDFTITVKDASQVNTLHNSTFTANSSIQSVYNRIEKSIGVSSFPSTFYFELTGQMASGPYISSPSLLPLIDDVTFYPEQAEITTSTYQIPWGANSVTDYTGMTAFQEFDGLGRSTLTLDKDKNIKLKNSYSFSSDPDVLTADFKVFDFNKTSPAILLTGTRIYVKSNLSIRFIADEERHENVTYEWDFGSGFISGTREMEQSFTIGIYNVKLRVSKSGYSSVTSNTLQVNAIVPLTICAEGLENYNPVINSVISNFEDCNLISTTTPPLATTFQVDTSDPIPLGTQRWKIRDIGASYWTNLNEDITQAQVTNINIRNASFEVIFEVWDANILKAQSNIIQVKFTY